MRKWWIKIHPVIPFAFHLSILPAELLSQIPRSTKHEWKSKGLQELFGYQYAVDQVKLLNTLQMIAANKRLIQINRALTRIIAIKKFITGNVRLLRVKHQSTVATVMSNIGKIASVISLRTTLKWSGFPYHKWLRLRHCIQCTASLLNQCRRKHPAQLLRRETDRIDIECNNPAFAAWPLSSIYHQCIRNGQLFCSLGTFYKYAAILADRLRLPDGRRKNHKQGIRVEKPLQILHADITQFETGDGNKAFIYFVQDNFSRAVLAYHVSADKKAAHTILLLKEIYNCYILKRKEAVSIVTDDGSENKTIRKELGNSGPRLYHLIAQKDISFSNSMIECLNKTIKYRYLYPQPVPDFESLKQVLSLAIADYNNRPAHVIGGLTPIEVLDGNVPNIQEIKEKVNKAAKKRIITNKIHTCCF